MNSDFLHDVDENTRHIVARKTDKKSERYGVKHELRINGLPEVEDIRARAFFYKTSADAEGNEDARNREKYCRDALKIGVVFIDGAERTCEKQHREDVLNENISYYAESRNFSDIFYTLFFILLTEIKLRGCTVKFIQ